MKNEIMKLLALKLSERRKKGDLKKMVARMCPAPEESIQEKYNYFYLPYHINCNTKKHMTFGSEDEEPEDGGAGWQGVHKFIYKDDPRTYLFVVN